MPRKTVRVRTRIAKRADVRNALESMPDNYLECYTGQHNWVLYKQIELPGSKGWERRHFCPRCKMNRAQVITRRGIRMHPKYERPADYGLRGIGTVKMDGRREALLEEVRRCSDKDLPAMDWADAVINSTV